MTSPCNFPQQSTSLPDAAVTLSRAYSLQHRCGFSNRSTWSSIHYIGW